MQVHLQRGGKGLPNLHVSKTGGNSAPGETTEQRAPDLECGVGPCKTLVVRAPQWSAGASVDKTHCF